MEDVAMTVIQTKRHLLNRSGYWPADPNAAVETRFRPADPHPPEDDGEPPMIPVASPPPLIPRVFPGL